MTKQEQLQELTTIIGDENVAKRVLKCGYVKADGIWASDGINNFGGSMVIHGYDTLHDLKLAKKDVERMIRIIAEKSIYDIIKFLAPYRIKEARAYLRTEDYERRCMQEVQQ